MASLIESGATGGILKYNDDAAGVINIIVAHLVDFRRGGSATLKITTTDGSMTLQLDNKAAVDTAIILIESKF